MKCILVPFLIALMLTFAVFGKNRAKHGLERRGESR